MNKKRPQQPTSKIREMLEKLENGEDIGLPKTTWTKPTPPGEEAPYINMAEHYAELNEDVETMCDPMSWEPPLIQNSLGFSNWVKRGLTLAEGNPVLEARMLRSVFDLMCEHLDDKTSRRIANAILSYDSKR
jgi:hypothetical protein